VRWRARWPRHVKTAGLPEFVAFAPDGKTAYIGSSHDTVTPVSTATGRAGRAIVSRRQQSAYIRRWREFDKICLLRHVPGRHLREPLPAPGRQASAGRERPAQRLDQRRAAAPPRGLHAARRRRTSSTGWSGTAQLLQEVWMARNDKASARPGAARPTAQPYGGIEQYYSVLCGDAPILVIGNTTDPFIPLRDAIAMTRQLASAPARGSSSSTATATPRSSTRAPAPATT
jgi:hypothetical protein